jgi:hypothetical protein
LREPPIDWLAPHPDQLVLAGLTRVGELYWVSADVVGAGVGVGRLACAGHASVSLPGGFRAAALARPDRLAAVTAANEVQWFRAEGQRLRDWAVPRRLPVPARAVAAFNRPGTDALAVVFEDGSAVCVPWPR